MDMMLISLAFVVGFILGGLIAFVAMTKFSAKHKLIDEMTKIKRANANKDRMIVEFFENAQEQFSLLNKVYINYAKFMQNNAERFIPQETEFFDDDNEQDLAALKVKKKSSDKAKAFVPETETKESFIPDVQAELDKDSADTATETASAKVQSTADDKGTQEVKDNVETKGAETESKTDVATDTKGADSGINNIIDDVNVAHVAEMAASSKSLDTPSQGKDSGSESEGDSSSTAEDKEIEVKEQPKI